MGKYVGHAAVSMKNQKCIVNGWLAFLLYASRVFGVTPVRLSSLQNGYCVSPSYGYALYSKILILLIHIAGIVGVFIDVEQNGLRIKFCDLFFWLSLCILTSSAVAAIGSFCSARRMTNMIENLNILEKIGTDINLITYDEVVPIKSKGISKMRLLIHLCTHVIILVHTATFNIASVIIKYSSAKSFLITHQLVYIINFFLAMQLTYMALRTCLALELINQKLEGLLRVNRLNNAREVYKDIRSLTHAYVSICDVAFKRIKNDGFIMFMIFAEIIVSLFLNSYYFFAFVISTSHYGWKLYSLTICIVSILKLLIFIENYHRITDEADHTRVLAGKLMYHMTEVGQRIPIELELMVNQLVLNTPQYSPLGMLVLRRSLIITIFSFLTTYAVYFVQIKIKIKTPLDLKIGTRV